MKRIVDHELLTWKNAARRKPLLVRGARQVGKTWSVLQLARQFDDCILVDFEKKPDMIDIFAKDLDPIRICSELELITGKKLVPGQTLLFLDEIQACPRAIMALRYFHEEKPDLHVIAAGSLLEFVLSQISFPVGRIQFLEMVPMGFLEFLQAKGNSAAAELLQQRPQELSETVHESLLAELRQYFFVGGMPESIKTFVNTGSLLDVQEVLDEICTSYRMDFSKYAGRSDPRALNDALISISRSVGNQIKYAALSDGFSQPVMKKAFELLRGARIIKRVRNANPSGLPLGAQISTKVFKAIMVDIGILQRLAGVSAKEALQEKDLLAIYRGRLAEQFVGQELVLAGQSDLYYWARKAKSSSAEVDYLALKDGKITPIEVKSGVAGRLRSMHMILDQYPSLNRGIVVSQRLFSVLPSHHMEFVPLYFVFNAFGGSWDV